MHLGKFGMLTSIETSKWTRLRQKLGCTLGSMKRGSLLHHENVEAIQLLKNSELLRRLQRTKPFELVS
jgi:hypothetical protein